MVYEIKRRFHKTRCLCTSVLLVFFFMMQVNFIQCSIHSILLMHKLATDGNAARDGRDPKLRYSCVEKFCK